MKKLLALVLALVMTLGLATVSTSAAYSDADDINYDEAVAVMSAIGVFQGKGSNFDPKANLNRAEAAKVVAYLMVGNKTAENLQGSGTKFTDVPASHWASGYIEYLASVGVVSGVGDNKFDPNGQVTAIQLAKMLLVALGYDAKIEGMVGSDWSINIQKLANKVGIFDGNKDVVGTAAVSRDEAALYSFNTIKSPLVEYDNNVTVDLNGNGSVTVGRNKAEYITSAKRADQTVSYETDTETGAWLVEFAERYYSDLKLETRQTNGDDYDLDDFGRPSREWTYKNDKVGEYSANTYLVAEFTAKVTPKKVYDAIGKTAYDNLNDGKSDLFVTRDGNKIVTNSVVTETTLAANIDSYANRTNDDSTVNSSGNGALTQVFMNDDNDVYIATINTYVLQATSDYSASSQELIVKAVGDTNIALKSYKLSAQDLDVQDFKKDDYILATAYATSNGTYEVDSVAKAELLTGEVNNWKNEDSVSLDGTTYKYSNTAKKSTDDGHVNNVKSTNYSVGQKAIVVLDKYGYIIAIDEAIVDENFVFVATFGTTSGINTNVVADAYFPDGTNKEITVKKVAGNDSKSLTDGMARQSANNTTEYGVIKKAGVTNANKTSRYAGWYSYSVDSDGKYTLRLPSGDYKQTALVYEPKAATTNILTNNKVAFLANTTAANPAANTEFVVSDNGTNNRGVNGTAVYANDKTVFVVATDDDVYTYVGVKNIPDLILGNTTAYNADTNPMGGAEVDKAKAMVFANYKGAENGGYANYVFVTFTDTQTPSKVTFTDSSNTALFYVLKEEGFYTTKDNKNYYKYDVIDENGSKITVEADDSEPFRGNDRITNNTGKVSGIYSAFYKTSKDADDRYSRATNLTRDDGKYFVLSQKASDKNANVANLIDYDNGTLTIGGVKFTLAEDYKLTMVSLKTATSYLNTSDGADYEITPNISASTLESRLKPLYDDGRTVRYTIQGRTDDSYTDGNTVLKEAYITIIDDGVPAAAANRQTVTFTGYNSATVGYTVAGVSQTITTATDPAITSASVISGRALTFTVTEADTAHAVKNVTANGVVLNATDVTTKANGTHVYTYTISAVNAATAIVVNVTGPKTVTVTLKDGTGAASTKADVYFGENTTAATLATNVATTTVAEGSSLNVTVTPNDGYSITAVKNGTSNVRFYTELDGSASFSLSNITAATSIDVTVVENAPEATTWNLKTAASYASIVTSVKGINGGSPVDIATTNTAVTKNSVVTVTLPANGTVKTWTYTVKDELGNTLGTKVLAPGASEGQTITFTASKDMTITITRDEAAPSTFIVTFTGAAYADADLVQLNGTPVADRNAVTAGTYKVKLTNPSTTDSAQYTVASTKLVSGEASETKVVAANGDNSDIQITVTENTSVAITKVVGS
jgi:hypothetical protein